MTSIVGSINKMIVNGNRLELPTDEHFVNYAQVKKTLLKAGGKYVKLGFTFLSDAQEIKDRLCGGEEINDKKKYQFFETPEQLATELVEIADVQPGHRVLEPSAGRGRIVSAALDAGAECVAVEIQSDNVNHLISAGYGEIHNLDFLALTPGILGQFDRVVANPPFTKNQDVQHIQHMFKFLKPGGRLVSIASPSWQFGQQKQQAAFRAWLEELGAEVTEIPEGVFKQSGTNVRTVRIVIDKVS